MRFAIGAAAAARQRGRKVASTSSPVVPPIAAAIERHTRGIKEPPPQDYKTMAAILKKLQSRQRSAGFRQQHKSFFEQRGRNLRILRSPLQSQPQFLEKPAVPSTLNRFSKRTRKVFEQNKTHKRLASNTSTPTIWGWSVDALL